jgi:hypothetical protein
LKPSILLSNGRYFDYTAPDPSVFDIEMIAGALSKQCRFSGQTRRFYSVAEHSWWASRAVPPEDALEALLHDGAESVIVDVPTPLKTLLPEYRAIEEAAHAAVAERFGLRFPFPASVIHADKVMLATEKRDIMPPTDEVWPHIEGIEPLPVNLNDHSGNPYAWERKFINRFNELVAAR